MLTSPAWNIQRARITGGPQVNGYINESLISPTLTLPDAGSMLAHSHWHCASIDPPLEWLLHHLPLHTVSYSLGRHFLSQNQKLSPLLRFPLGQCRSLPFLPAIMISSRLLCYILNVSYSIWFYSYSYHRYYYYLLLFRYYFGGLGCLRCQ